MVIRASDYDRSCAEQSDCVGVGEGDTCTAPCGIACPTTAVNQVGLARYQAALAAAHFDVDNVGAAVRNAAAFDADAVVLSPRCADPYYRKAIRVSMASVFFLPMVRCQSWPDGLLRLRQTHGLQIVGAVLDPRAVPLQSFRWPDKIALLVGAEGPGLTPQARRACDHLVTIPMASTKADSLNVATATGILLHARAAGTLV